MTAEEQDIHQAEEQLALLEMEKAPEIPRLHQSTAHTLLTKTPLHAWWFHPQLGANQREDTDAFSRGNLFDRLLFNTGPEVVEITGYDDFKTKAAQQLRDAALAEKKIPVLSRKLEEARASVLQLKARLAEKGVFLSENAAQEKVLWVEPETEVACEGRLDHRQLESGLMWVSDFKTTKGADEEGFTRSVINYGYDIQAHAYTEAIEQCYPEFAGRVRFRWLVWETVAPYALAVYEPSGAMRKLGAHKWKKAAGIWQRCLANNRWPGYAGTAKRPEPLHPKSWHLTGILEEGEAIDL